MPLIGLLLEPIIPTMREETVTKNAPNITTKTPSNNLLPIELPGIIGMNAINNINAMLPNKTTFKLKIFFCSQS